MDKDGEVVAQVMLGGLCRFYHRLHDRQSLMKNLLVRQVPKVPLVSNQGSVQRVVLVWELQHSYPSARGTANRIKYRRCLLQEGNLTGR